MPRFVPIVIFVLFSVISGQNVTENEALMEFVEKTLSLYDLNKNLGDMGTSIASQTVCSGCAIGVGLLFHFVRNGKQQHEVSQLISFLCKTFQIQSAEVCDGAAFNFAPDVTHIIKVGHSTPDEFCSLLLPDACKDVFSKKNNWEVTLPEKRSENLVNPVPKVDAPRLKVLHIADTHIDELYAEGSNAACKDGLCCRVNDQKWDQSEANKAGRWGDYRNCDTPPRLMQNLLEHINQQHKDISYIIWTGDLPPHDVWSLTKQKNLKIIKDGIAQIHRAFPNIPVYPAIGNHETVPINLFPTPPAPGVSSAGYNMDWLYNELDTEWRRWLPASTSETIKRGAFYSVSAGNRFRIISINSNFCYHLNWWLLLDSEDPADELRWLIDELHKAENNSEKVHIVGHVPPGNADCVKVWSRNFNAIIQRFEHIVMGQFYGHTHYDEFAVQYDLQDSSRAINVEYVGPSVTPFSDLNPAYRIYYVDGDHAETTRAIVDHETWTMNLTHANLNNNTPSWYKLYSAKAAFNLTSLAPEQWNRLIERMALDDEVFAKYYSFYYRKSDRTPNCDAKCRKTITCDARSGRSHDRQTLCKCINLLVDEDEKMSYKMNLYKDLSYKFANPAAWFQPRPQS